MAVLCKKINTPRYNKTVNNFISNTYQLYNLYKFCTVKSISSCKFLYRLQDRNTNPSEINHKTAFIREDNSSHHVDNTDSLTNITIIQLLTKMHGGGGGRSSVLWSRSFLERTTASEKIGPTRTQTTNVHSSPDSSWTDQRSVSFFPFTQLTVGSRNKSPAPAKKNPTPQNQKMRHNYHRKQILCENSSPANYQNHGMSLVFVRIYICLSNIEKIQA